MKGVRGLDSKVKLHPCSQLLSISNTKIESRWSMKYLPSSTFLLPSRQWKSWRLIINKWSSVAIATTTAIVLLLSYFANSWTVSKIYLLTYHNSMYNNSPQEDCLHSRVRPTLNTPVEITLTNKKNRRTPFPCALSQEQALYRPSKSDRDTYGEIDILLRLSNSCAGWPWWCRENSSGHARCVCRTRSGVGILGLLDACSEHC